LNKGKFVVDLDAATVEVSDEKGTRLFSIGTAEGFNAVSDIWLRAGWDAKYVYSFTWMGRPIIQLPDDLIRIQEIIFAIRPTVVIETGIAHGGSLIFYASLLKAMDVTNAKVIGIDIEVRPHNRRAIEEHALFPYLILIEGSSIDPEIVKSVRSKVDDADRVMVMLDSNHTKQHVLAELEAYAPLVTPGSYIIAADGIMGSLTGAPRSSPDWDWNNPRQAALEFAGRRSDFVIEEPRFPFNEGATRDRVTYWPQAFIKRIR
jgi:cephalosporin hydroxylase